MILDNIYNHYEKLVFDEVLAYQSKESRTFDESMLEDVVCVALNNLPSRYVRHSVDIAFYLTIPERVQMDTLVRNAVEEAFSLVTKNPHED
ncbi:MAG: late competence development ComFB family protein [Ectothiorhodospiraceae bacterium]|nr:late competence development ComFB family protein [Ectothiorhodospiraceae bacterium]